MFLDKKKLTDQLLNVAGNSDRPLLIHTDLLKIGLIEKMKRPDQFLQDHKNVFDALAKRRTLIFPCFNYDFCKSGLYDVRESPSQVGAFADFLRKNGTPRSQTPIFSFCVMGEVEAKYMAPSRNVFGPESIFSLLAESHGDILFYGATIASNTFIHLTEERLSIGYRYLKAFKGQIISDRGSLACSVDYRVRPRGVDPFQYDWPKMYKDLVENGVAQVAPIGNSESLMANAMRFLEFTSEKMRKFEFEYLTPATQTALQQVQKSKKYPFHISDFES